MQDLVKLVASHRTLWLAPFILGLLAACSSGNESSTAGGACVVFWVSPSGDDVAGDGSGERPFKTIGKAKLAVRGHPSRGACPIDVNIRSGVYALTEALKFDAGDSGGPGGRISYQAAPGNPEPVVISGGLEIAGFSCAGGRCEARVDTLPERLMPRQFYVDDRRAIRARSNYTSTAEGYALGINPDYGRVSNGYKPVSQAVALTNPELVEAVSTEQWKMMRCPVDHVESGTLVMRNPCWKNANTYTTVIWSFYQLSWLENAPEFLTHEDMWYLDPYRKVLRYNQLGSRAPQKGVLPVLESLLEVVGTEQAPVSFLGFSGLEFSYAGWYGPNSANGYASDQSGNMLIGDQYAPNAFGHQKLTYSTPGNVTLRYAQNISFVGNAFRHLGAVALSLQSGSQNNLIQGNQFSDISSSAIQIGGVGEADWRGDGVSLVSGNTVTRNVVEYTGQDYWDSAGVYVGFAARTLIANNTFRHTPWSAVAIGWGWGLLDDTGFPGAPGSVRYQWGQFATPTVMSGNQILNNRFSYFLERLWDGGAIYTNGAQGQSYETGLLIEGNVAEYKRPNAGGNVFYTDAGSRFITIKQNASLYSPVGTVDLGPCGYPTSFEGAGIADDLCLATGLVPYGSDMGGCLPYGDLRFTGNYFGSPHEFFTVCPNHPVPPGPPQIEMANIGITSPLQVPTSLLDGAGAY
jgi:hypothetical protein